MSSSFSRTIRLATMLAFLVGMPVLALPNVNRWVDSRLFGSDGVIAAKSVEKRIVAAVPTEAEKGAEIQAQKPNSTNSLATGRESIENSPPNRPEMKDFANSPIKRLA